MKLVMDSDVLIKITKASIKDIIVSNFEVSIPSEVKTETVDEGKSRGHTDAVKIEENIARKKLKVIMAKGTRNSDRLIAGLNLLGGEAASLRLFMRGGYGAIASDDGRFVDLLGSLGIAYMTPASLLIRLVRQKRISSIEVRQYLEGIRSFISPEEYLVSQEALREES